jgi:hypothetical protein
LAAGGSDFIKNKDKKEADVDCIKFGGAKSLIPGD